MFRAFNYFPPKGINFKNILLHIFHLLSDIMQKAFLCIRKAFVISMFTFYIREQSTIAFLSHLLSRLLFRRLLFIERVILLQYRNIYLAFKNFTQNFIKIILLHKHGQGTLEIMQMLLILGYKVPEGLT